VRDKQGMTVCLPPGPRLPRTLQGLAFILRRQQVMRLLHRVYGPSFTVDLPLFGRTVVITEPALIKQLFQTKAAIVGVPDFNLGVVLGSGSLFSLDGAQHHRRRKLVVPPLHGRRLQAYEAVVEEEVRREAATWPAGVEFETLPSMARITLNIILRTVFGAEGTEFDQLRDLLPPLVALGSKVAGIPYLRPDLGACSPGGRYLAYRRRFDDIVDSLTRKALAEPSLEDRQDVLALLLQARYEDGEAMTQQHIADELLTLLAAGHETTATTLAWAFERIRRHPAILYRLAREADAGDSKLRQATILEVQRTRPVIDTVERQVKAPAYALGDWVIPRGHTVMAAIDLVHHADSVFPNAASFDPDRFLGVNPDTYSWVPFGGGTRRCVGAAFANMEMNVVLRTVLQEFELGTTYAPPERAHWRGIAICPSDGGRLVVHRKTPGVRDQAPLTERAAP
jgi:cytochrome P450 family 138